MFKKRHLSAFLAVILAQNVTFAETETNTNPFATAAEKLNLEENLLLYNGGAFITAAILFEYNHRINNSLMNTYLRQADALSQTTLYRAFSVMENIQNRLWLAEEDGSKESIARRNQSIEDEKKALAKLNSQIETTLNKIKSAGPGTQTATLTKLGERLETLRGFVDDIKENIDWEKKFLKEANSASLTTRQFAEQKRKLKQAKVRFLNRAFKDGIISGKYKLNNGRIISATGRTVGAALEADIERAKAASDGQHWDLWRKINNHSRKAFNARVLGISVAVVGVGMIAYHLIDNNDVDVAKTFHISDDDERLAHLESLDDEALDKVMAIIGGVTAS